MKKIRKNTKKQKETKKKMEQNNISEALQKYLELQKECNSLAYQWKFQESRNLRKNAISIMNEFTKEDWQKLIDMTPNIHAKIDWTRMMNERFPENKE